MPYCTVADIREEGVAPAQAGDERLARLIDEAGRLVDRLTGWLFEPRELVLRLDGRGAPTIEPPVPPIRLDRLTVHGSEWPIDTDHLVVVGAPVAPGFDAPRLTLRHGRFPRGRGNVLAEGLWGYTEDNGTATGRTPPAIRRACMLLVLRLLPTLGDTDLRADARDRWRLIEERIRDQSYKLGPPPAAGTLTGDPEVDAILVRYCRPPAMGAA